MKRNSKVDAFVESLIRKRSEAPPPDDGQEQDDQGQDDGGDALTQAAQELLDAVRTRDKAALADALETAVRAITRAKG